jgi:hypothetical protein
MAEDHR